MGQMKAKWLEEQNAQNSYTSNHQTAANYPHSSVSNYDLNARKSDELNRKNMSENKSNAGSSGFNENQVAFDFLASIGREKIELDSPKYMEKLEKIAKQFDLVIKKHPIKGHRGYCKTCDSMGTTITFDGGPVKCLCDHQVEERDKEQLQVKQQDELKKIEHLRHLSLLGDKYKNVSWNNTRTGSSESFDSAHRRCYKYSQIPDEIQKGAFGLYLWGDKGVGKTHLTAAIANSLLGKGVPVLFTSLFEISKAIKKTYQKGSMQFEQNLIEQFARINFLIFDDLGSEIFTKNESDAWLQGLLYDLINKRYNNDRATIFTSNYDLNELVSQRKIMEKTVDRIQEMTKGAIIKIKGESQRKSIYGDNTPF